MAHEVGAAYQKLGQNPKAQRLRERFRAYYLQLAEEAEPELQGPRQIEWLELLESEHDNLRAALEWTIASDGDAALRMATALQRFWWRHPSEGGAALKESAAASPSPSPLRARALISVALLSEGVAAEAPSLIEEGLEVARALGDDAEIARGLLACSQHEYHSYAYERARSDAEAALDHAQRANDRYLIGRANHWIGRATAVLTGRVNATRQPNARSYIERALEIAREAEDLATIVSDLYPLSLNSVTGDEQKTFQREALQLSRALGDDVRLCEALDGIAWGALFGGDGVAAARVAWDEAAATARRAGFGPQLLRYYLTIGGMAARFAGDADAARLMFEEARALISEGGPLSPVTELALLELQLGNLDRALAFAEDAVTASRASGHSDGSSMLALGAVLRARGDDAGARRVFEDAYALTNEGGHGSQAGNAARSLGLLATRHGDFDEARAWFERAGQRTDGPTHPQHLASLALAEGDVAKATALHRQALEGAKGRGDVRWALPWSYEGLADVAIALGDPVVATCLLAAAAGARESYGCVREAWYFAGNCDYLGGNEWELRLDHLRAALGDEAYEKAWAEGRAMTEAEAIEYALAAP